MNKIKKQKNKNYGDVINGDKFGLDEKAVEALISNAVAVLSQQFEGVRKNNEDLIDGVRNELYKQILDIKNGQADIRGAAQNNFKRIEAHQQEFTSQIMTVLTTLANRLGGMEEALSYFRSQSAKAANDNYDRFSKWQEDQIENARKNLIRETSREHPNIDNVKECALALLEMASDDFLARFYLAACSENYRDAITFLNETNVDEHTQEELKEVIDYLTKHLRSEWILSASALVERSSPVLGRDENSFRKEIRGPFEREVQKIGRGIYNIIPDGCVFIAYNHDDIAEVSKLIDYLEEAPEIQCFAAFRNVRNGLGAEEYDKILRRAMSRCSVFVLYSTYQSRNMGGSFEEIDHIVQDDYNRAERSGHPEFGKNGDYKHLPAGYKKPRVEYLKESYRPNEANSLAKMFFGDARHRTEPKELRNRILDLLHGCEEEPPEEQRKAEEMRKAEEELKQEPWLAPDYPTLENYDKSEFDIEEIDGKPTLLQYLKNGFNGEVKVPFGVIRIGKGAFQPSILKGESKILISSITIPNSVTTISEEAFLLCTWLTELKIPKSVTSIEDDAFSFCENLERIEVAEGNPEYRSEQNCLIERSTNSLVLGCKNSVIPDGVTSIGSGAFHGCSNLTSIVIPNSVIEIERYAFSFCGLTSVKIPDSVTAIGSSAFDGCESLTTIKIPDSVTAIGSSAFFGCKSLTSITIPNSVTSIWQWAFASCRELTSIAIPDSVTVIGAGAFSSCSWLTSVFIPKSVTRLGEAAFERCGNLKIYCAAKEQPQGWEKNWNPDNRPVVWGYWKYKKK